MFYSSRPGLYVHIPFCLSRCGYCAFVSSVYDSSRADEYLTALEREWQSKRALFTTSPGTVYIGGGTPSALTPAQLERLLRILPLPGAQGKTTGKTTGKMTHEAACEITCEVNPESASPDKLALLREYGVNRLSIGVQTFSPDGLAVLGRRHREGDAAKVIHAAQRLGFTSISLDLIHGWPGQSAADAIADIKKSANLGIQHISNYALTLDETAAGYGKLKNLMPEEDDAAARALWDKAEAELARYCFRHYETSNFAREGFVCRHNAAIWQGGEYLGLGAAAHSHWGGRRFANTPSLDDYIRRGGVGAEVFSENLEGLAKARETAVFWLRLFDGIDLADYRARTGYSFQEVYPVLPEGVKTDTRRAWVPAGLQAVLDGILVDMV